MKDPVPTGWAPGQVWTGGEKLAPPTGIRTPRVAVPTEISRPTSYDSYISEFRYTDVIIFS